jgi:hypothetical protein
LFDRVWAVLKKIGRGRLKLLPQRSWGMSDNATVWRVEAGEKEQIGR